MKTNQLFRFGLYFGPFLAVLAVTLIPQLLLAAQGAPLEL